MYEDNCNAKEISNEVRELVDNIEKFVEKRDLCMKDIKEMFLSTSNSN